MRQQTDTTATITAGQTISSYAEVRGHYIGFYAPSLVAGALYIRGSKDKGVTSGRVQKEDGSGDYATASTTGVACFTVPMHFPYRWIAIESASAQTTTDRVFTIVGKE